MRNTLEQRTQKTDDALHLSSRYDFQYTERASWGAFLDFQTQFDKGYDPEASLPDYSSRFMAPAYFKAGPTFGYRLGKAFYLNLSFVALKLNIVLDDALSQRGAYGVHPGEKVLTQLGANLNAYCQVEVLQNVKAENRLSLYADYLRNFGNVDVNDKLLLTFHLAHKPLLIRPIHTRPPLRRRCRSHWKKRGGNPLWKTPTAQTKSGHRPEL